MSRKGFDLIVCLGLVSLIGYLSWHAINGERSFSQAERLAERVEALEAQRAKVRSERVAFDARVALIRPESIDPDLLEELARVKLGFVSPSDVVLHIDP